MILDEVISIRKVGKKQTIDIEVDGDSLFYCNGILTHNSASGDTNDISEENIQGGIAKIQSADNVIAFIPNSMARERNVINAKILKSRDSSGVGGIITFKQDWSTLSFIPLDKDDATSDDDDVDWKSKSQSNIPKQTFIKNEKPILRRKPTTPTTPIPSKPSDDTETEPVVKTATSVIRGIKGKNTLHRKKIKML